MKLTEAEMRMVFQMESTNQNAGYCHSFAQISSDILAEV